MPCRLDFLCHRVFLRVISWGIFRRRNQDPMIVNLENYVADTITMDDKDNSCLHVHISSQVLLSFCRLNGYVERDFVAASFCFLVNLFKCTSHTSTAMDSIFVQQFSESNILTVASFSFATTLFTYSLTTQALKSLSTKQSPERLNQLSIDIALTPVRLSLSPLCLPPFLRALDKNYAWMPIDSKLLTMSW